MRTISTITLFLSLALLDAVPTLAQTGHDLFQQALVKERAGGDLRGAIAIYDRIAQEFTADRQLAARALMQLGQCYEKLGSTEAERAYRRVVREFADQNDLVARAQSRLAALQRAARAEEEENITTRQVWLDRSGSTEPLAPTANGRHLLFVDWGSWSSNRSVGVGDLAIQDITSGESRLLTHEATQDDPQQWVWGASVSPDGGTAAYLWTEGRTGSLRLIGVDGSNPRVLYREEGCGFASVPAWTHDSNHLVALHMCGGSDELVLISIEDGIARRIAAAASLAAWGPVSLSPDDRYAALEVARDDGDSRDIWLVALDKDDAVPLIQHPSDDRLVGWVPGTKDMLFLSDRDGQWDLWSVRGAGPVAEGPPRLVRRNMGRVTMGGWSPLGFTSDGALFYSVFTRGNSLSVASFDLTTGSADEESAVSILGFNRWATWSPDGEYLAFVSDQERPGGYHRPLRVRHLASGAERELAPQLQAQWPKWSPDGRFILMNGWDETDQSADYHGGLYLVDVESGEPSPVLERKGNEAPDAMPGGALWWWYGISAVWAPGGEAVIYSRYYGNLREGRLVWRELESGREKLLYRDSLLATRLFALSPDGHRLVFGVRDSLGDFGGSVAPINTGGRLMVLDLEDGAIRELYAIREPGYVESLQWTPDGEYVLFSRGEEPDPHTGVWRVSADGGEAEELWTFGAGSDLGRFALSPDGRRVAYDVSSQEFEVWVMENLKTVLAGRN
jgi:Tol biopolymer transport system component